MDEQTTIRVYGNKNDVEQVCHILLGIAENITIKSLFMQPNDCSLVLANVKEIKLLIDPCEIRVKTSELTKKELRHPFLFVMNYLREVTLIGTHEEILKAE